MFLYISEAQIKPEDLLTLDMDSWSRAFSCVPEHMTLNLKERSTALHYTHGWSIFNHILLLLQLLPEHFYSESNDLGKTAWTTYLI